MMTYNGLEFVLQALQNELLIRLGVASYEAARSLALPSTQVEQQRVGMTNDLDLFQRRLYVVTRIALPNKLGVQFLGLHVGFNRFRR